MNTIIEFAKILLWACIEDYAGIWELLWEVNSKFPALSEGERKHMVLQVLQLLLDQGLIRLYSCKEPYGELFELNVDSARAALSDEKNWEPPKLTGISIRAGATEKGEALYRSGTVDLLC